MFLNRKGLLFSSGLVLLSGGSTIPFINNSNLFTNIFSARGGGDKLAPYFRIGDSNQKNLHLSNSSVRPSQALEEVKNLKTSNLDLKIKNPNLNIQEISKTGEEKKNIENIYQEINREVGVLKIEKDKDEQYKKLEESLRNYRENYSDFLQSIPKTIEKIKKKEKNRSRQPIVVRFKRSSIDVYSQEFNILKEIDPIKDENKQAVLKFYESYLKSLTQQNSLFKQLKQFDSSVKNRKTKSIEKLEEKNKYLEKLNLNGSNTSVIDLSKNKEENTLPKDLLSDKLHKLMKNKWQELDKEIKDMEVSWQLELCKGTSSIPLVSLLWGGYEGCHNTLNWKKENQKILQQAVDFQALIKLLKDMNQHSPQFAMVYEGREEEY